ncbi:MAG: alpha/beta hydrolase [Betaproteobacteria bacterium]|nr:MAG: alpha/beta hydrolase [Betaproteobacteria bacterium]
MKLDVGGKEVFAYTANHELDPAKRTVVFVHGAGLDHSWFGLQSRYFGYHGWNVLAVDLPGHGRSEGPPLTAVPAMADWLVKLLGAAKIERVSLVGHSMGTLVALDCAARHPALVERVALIATAQPMKVSDAFLDAAKRNSYDAFDMSTIWGHAPQVPLGGNPNPGMWMYGDTQARLERLAPGVLYADLKASNDYVFPGGVKRPVLFILGKRDVMTPPRAAKTLQEQIPGAQTVLIDFSGHSLMAEAPDATLDALIKFLQP